MNSFKLLFILILCFILMFSCNIRQGLAQETYIYTNDESININVYEKVSPTVVTVVADAKEGASNGAGVIIDPSGIVLSSSHVVGNSKKVFIITSNGEKLQGIVKITTGKPDDLAIIHVNTDKLLKAASLGDSTQIRVGQKVLAIGNPFGLERTLTTGIISRIDNEKERIQTDAAINPGSSGGPLLNTKGQIIGINQSLYNPVDSRSNIGISFSVPINVAKRLMIKTQSGANHSDAGAIIQLKKDNSILSKERSR